MLPGECVPAHWLDTYSFARASHHLNKGKGLCFSFYPGSNFFQEPQCSPSGVYSVNSVTLAHQLPKRFALMLCDKVPPRNRSGTVKFERMSHS